jgi:L-gulonolactone oxidase
MASSAATATAGPPPLAPQSGMRITNWAATYTANPASFFEPASVEEVRAAVLGAAKAGRVVRAVGSACSPNDCAMSDDVMVSLRRMNRVLEVDRARRLVKVEGGATLASISAALEAHHLALPNLGSISDQTIAGCIATGTHGTGAREGVLATNIVQLEAVLSDGSVRVLSRDGVQAASSSPSPSPSSSPLPLDGVDGADLFRAFLCSLGCLGIITGVVIQAVPAFDLRATERPDSFSSVLADLGARVASAPFYRFHWYPHTDHIKEWRAEPVEPRAHRAPPPSAAARAWAWLRDVLFGFHLLQLALLVSLAVPALVPLINRVWRRAVNASKTEVVDRSDRVFNFNCLFQQHVDEWAVPVAHLPAVLSELRAAIDTCGFKAHFPVEVRFVAGDDIPLSPSYGHPTAWIGVIAYKPFGFEPEFKPYFAAFERILAAHGGRPHWAKDFGLRGDAGFARAYPLWHHFKALRERVDPTGVFANAWARRTLGLLPPGGGGQVEGTDAALAAAAAAGKEAAASVAANESYGVGMVVAGLRKFGVEAEAGEVTREGGATTGGGRGGAPTFAA